MKTYNLVWNNETIDSFNTRDEAERMANEYSIAYNGPVAVIESDDYSDDDQGVWSDFGEEGLREDFEDDFEENDNWDMDGDALASAGFGTDEDYGYYGDGEW
tara:strand:- start:1740 stop:2045 length:306 start_codon:yes stop_codon:yes gene_type:complete